MKTIVWDVDDVLNNLMYDWLLHHAHFGIPYTELKENPPHALLGITMEEYLQSLDAFRSEYFSRLQPVREILDWFETNGANYRHVALTATPISFAALSSHWVLAHFGKWIRSFNFIPSKREHDNAMTYDHNKAEFLAQFRSIDLVIDDSEENVRRVKDSGIPSVLMPRPWNRQRLETLTDFLTKIKP